MTNLVSETIGAVARTNATPVWVGSRDGTYAMPWSEFCEKFADLGYDSGYGGQEIADDLVVMLEDGSWLSRGEYDGSEWWRHNQAPAKQPNAQPFEKVTGGYWESVGEMNA